MKYRTDYYRLLISLIVVIILKVNINYCSTHCITHCMSKRSVNSISLSGIGRGSVRGGICYTIRFTLPSNPSANLYIISMDKYYIC